LDETGKKRKARIIRLGQSGDFQKDVQTAADILLSGGLVVCPTESVYGLAVDAANEEAVKRLFLVKRRQPGLPILILLPSAEALSKYAAHIPSVARRLIEEFWPGGLTIVFEARQTVSSLLTAGTGKIGVRLSIHPVATALAQAAGAAITGTSANMSGFPACCNAKEVLRVFEEKVDLVLDCGEVKGGGGSTILDVTFDPPRILRDGMIDRVRLKKFLSAKI